MIQRAHPHDIPKLLSIARERYGRFNERGADQWLREKMSDPETCIIHSDDAAAIATLGQPFWGGPKRAHLLFLMCRRFPGLSRRGLREGVALMKALDVWRQSQGAESFDFGEDTGANFDVLARHLGASPAPQTYRLGGTEMSFAVNVFQSTEPQQRRAMSVLQQLAL